MRAIDAPNIRLYSDSCRRHSWREDMVFRCRAEYKEGEPYMTDYYDTEDTMSLRYQNGSPWEGEDNIYIPVTMY